MAEWACDEDLRSLFITHCAPNGYEIHFATSDMEKYLAVQEECRRQIGHAKPQTGADKIRKMSDEEIEEWYWWMHKEMMYYTDSHVFVHAWLKQEVQDADD